MSKIAYRHISSLSALVEGIQCSNGRKILRPNFQISKKLNPQNLEIIWELCRESYLTQVSRNLKFSASILRLSLQAAPSHDLLRRLCPENNQNFRIPSSTTFLLLNGEVVRIDSKLQINQKQERYRALSAVSDSNQLKPSLPINDVFERHLFYRTMVDRLYFLKQQNTIDVSKSHKLRTPYKSHQDASFIDSVLRF